MGLFFLVMFLVTCGFGWRVKTTGG